MGENINFIQIIARDMEVKTKNKKAISSRPQSYNINKNKIVRKDKKNVKKMNAKNKI